MAAARVAPIKSRVRIEDFLFVLRKDEQKLARAEELLFRFDDLQRARKAFDTNDEPS
jgi:transcription initiation factor TFIID subunit 13